MVWFESISWLVGVLADFVGGVLITNVIVEC